VSWPSSVWGKTAPMRSPGPVESLTQRQTTHAVSAFLAARNHTTSTRPLSVNVQSLRDRFPPRPAEQAWAATVQPRGEVPDRWNGHRSLRIRRPAVVLEARALNLKSRTKSLHALIPLASLFSPSRMRTSPSGPYSSHPCGRREVPGRLLIWRDDPDTEALQQALAELFGST
jgi:hypothetical protein